jgi:hypothetical protein
MNKGKGLKMLFERLDTDKIIKEAIATSERVRFAVHEAGITADEVGVIVTDGGEIVETDKVGAPVVLWIDGRSGTAEKVMRSFDVKREKIETPDNDVIEKEALHLTGLADALNLIAQSDGVENDVANALWSVGVSVKASADTITGELSKE